MHLTPAILESAYTYLRATPPFKNWKLPESDAVEFRVIATRRNKKTNGILYGDFNLCAGRDGLPVIRISCTAHKRLLSVQETMAHEMVHMHQRQTDQKATSMHGPKFKRLAAQVCKQHGFDPKTF
jgi:uncharacterized protein (DUF885 family)